MQVKERTNIHSRSKHERNEHRTTTVHDHSPETIPDDHPYRSSAVVMVFLASEARFSGDEIGPTSPLAPFPGFHESFKGVAPVPVPLVNVP